MRKSIILLAIMVGTMVGYVNAGTLEFDGVPVDITTSSGEDLVIVPGEGGNTQVGDGNGSNTYATSNDDLHITGILEVDGDAYFDSSLTFFDVLTAGGGITSGAGITSDTDSTDDLGTSLIAWANIFADKIKTTSGTNLIILPTSAYTIIGDAASAAGNTLDNDDLFITGKMEIDEMLYADGGITANTIASSGANLALNPASSYGLTSSVTRSAATGDEAAFNLAATINKATSGNYTGLKLNVTETSAPGTADKLLDLQAGGTSWLSVYNGANSANYGAVSVGSGGFDGTTSGYFTGLTSGTLLAGNAASGFLGNLIDMQVAGNSKFSVDASGNVVAAGTITGGGSGLAPINATYITQTADTTLTAEQALSTLDTGLMKVTTATGVVSSITDSAGIAGVISDETGSGSLVLGTAPTFTTSLTSPLVIGGTTTTSDLNLQTTLEVGAAGADMHFLVGNNGATEAMTILNSGYVGIGTTAPNNTLQVADLINFNNTDYNSLLGYQAGKNVVSGAQSNTFVGYQAGFSSVAGSTDAADNNTAIGYQSLYSNTTGYNNNASGWKALYSNTTGYYNNAMGDYALALNTTGNRNNAMGSGTLQSNTTGRDNVAVGGENALWYNTTGRDNVAIGSYALSSNQAGNYNVGIGRRAGGSDRIDNSFSNNVLIGYYAGNLLSTGSNNILFGFRAGDAITTGANNIVLGYDIDAPSPTGSNQLTIGNLIFGTGIDGTGTTISSGNIGISQTSPTFKLDITGDLRTTTGAYFATSSGNVGVGTTSPTATLHIDPAAQTTTTATFARTFIDNTNAITTNTGNAAVHGLMIDEPNITVGTATPTNASSLYISGAPTEATNNYSLWVDDGNVQLDGNLTVGGTITASGIGDITSVGNVTSGAAFDGTQGTTLTFYNAGGNGILSYDGTNFNLDKPAVIATSLTSPTIIGGTTTTSGLNLKTTSAVGTTGADMHFLVGNNGATEAMTVLNSGNVGIGTTVPAQKLHVEGQCVTGDTLLPILSAKEILNPKSETRNESKNSTSNDQNNLEYVAAEQSSADSKANALQLQYIPIKDVKPGDYVLSLNEETGAIEPHRINGLLDMRVKPVFKMTTADGRYIKTTGNHPYLVKLEAGSLKLEDREKSAVEKLGFEIEGEIIAEDSPVENARWLKVAGLSVGDEIATANEINAHASPSFYGGGQHTVKSTQKQEWSALQLWQSLVSLLPRIDNYTQDKKDNTKRHETNAQHYRQFFKKVTCKSYSQNSLAHISNVLCNKLPGFFVNNYHLAPLAYFPSVIQPNEYVFASLFDDAQDRALQAQKQQAHQHQSKILSYFLSSFVSRMDKVCQDEKKKPAYSQSNSHPYRQFYKKFACYRYGKNSFGNICQILSCKFPFNFIYYSIHWEKVYHSIKKLSNFFFNQPVYADAATSHILWDKIVSIEYIGEEQVYDIEVEGTHNFVANGIIAHNTYISSNLGIGTTAPEFKLTLDKGATTPDGGILSIGTYGSGTALTTAGAGTRMIWYPKKAAFRAGYVDGTQWDDANVGIYSTAIGYNAKASGTYSTAMGPNTTASGIYSTAMGNSTTSSGASSTAMGYQTTASGTVSISAGNWVTAGTAANTIVLGQGIDNSNRLVNNTASSLMVGFNSTIPTLFVGPSSGAGTTGNVGIGTSSPTAKLDVDGAIQTVTAPTQRAIINNTNAITTNTGATAVYGLTVDEPNITVGTATPTNAASLYISGAPTEATNNYALWVDDGNVQLDGNLTVGGTITASGIGDITSVGNVPSGAAFDGTQGTTLTFYNAGGNGILSYDGTKFNLDKPAAIATSLTSPTIIGGTTTTSDLTLQTTLEVGATGADMHFLVGNNGATEAMTILNSGYVGIGTTGPAQKLHVEGQCVTGDTLVPVIRLGDRSWELGAGSKNKGVNDGVSVRKAEGVANGNGIGRGSLQNNREISEGGTIRHCKSDAQSGSICATEYSGRQGQVSYESICPVSVSGERVDMRGNDCDENKFETKISERSRSGEDTENMLGYIRGDQRTNQFAKITSSSQPSARKKLGDRSEEIGENYSQLLAPSSQLLTPNCIEYIPITDVKPGDYVLSLNEETGEIEPRRINGLLDMGIKPVFKMTTADGHHIKTTGNHPYIVKGNITEELREAVAQERIKTISLKETLAIENFSEEKEFAEPKYVWINLLAEEDKEGSYNRPELTHDESKCPTDNFSTGPGNFNTQFFDFYRERGFGLLNLVFNSFLGNLIQDFYQSFSAAFAQFFPQDIWYSNYSHNFLLLNIKNLLTEESRYNSQNNYHLTNRDANHPLYEVGFEFRKPLFDFSFKFSQLLFKTTFSHLQSNFFCAFFDLCENTNQSRSCFISKFFPQDIRYSNNRHNSLLVYIKNNIHNLFCQAQNNNLAYASIPNYIENNDANWLKVIYLQEGDEIAVSPQNLELGTWNLENAPAARKKLGDRSEEIGENYSQLSTPSSQPLTPNSNAWDKIVSIEYVGEEQVYDIEVEGTHNFIAGHFINVPAARKKLGDRSEEIGENFSQLLTPNPQLLTPNSFFGGIIAHNTYISGNVGIGTTEPSEKLQVNAGTDDILARFDSTNTANSRLFLSVPANADSQISFAEGETTKWTIGSDGSDSDKFKIMPSYGAFDGSEVLTIQSDGNVGIGTTAPNGPLEVTKSDTGSLHVFRGFNTNSSGQAVIVIGESEVFPDFFAITKNGSTYTADPNAVSLVNYANGFMSFETNNTERMRITSGGYVGIGTTSPTSPLQVDPAAQTTTAATFARTFIDNTNAITTNTGNTAVHGLMIDEPNITVGTATPTNASSLYISGAPTEATNNYALWVDDGNVQLDGNLTVGGTITGTVASAAPKDATYITQTANDTLTAEQALSTLDTGLMKVTTATGVISSITDSAGIAGVISDETGTGSLVLGTTPTFTTSLTSPLIIGGTTTTSDINLKTTSGVGTTGADMHFLVGNNGTTEAMTILNSGNVGIGTTAPGSKLSVSGGGSFGSTYAASAMADGNVAISGNLGIGTTSPSASLDIVNIATAGGLTTLELNPGAHTAMTAEKSDFSIAAHTDTITGGYAAQRFSVFDTPTISAASALTVTNADTVNIAGIPTASGSAVISGASALRIPVAPQASAKVGLVSLGSGAWDGSTAGYFGTGSSSNSNGTLLAVNTASGYAGDLANFEVAGVSKFKVDASGNVTAAGTITATGVGDITSVGNVSSGAAFDGTQGTTLTFYNVGGNGILSYDGTNFNLDKSAVIATSLTSPTIIGGTTTTSDLNFKTTTGIGAAGADMHFLVGNNGATEAMTVLNSGYVGIGTTAPIGKLTVVSPYSDTFGSRKGIELTSGTGANEWWSFGLSSAGNLVIDDLKGSVAALTILTNSGNVGIGTTSPAAPLNILDTYVANSGQLRISDASSQYYGTIGYTSSGSTHFVINNSYANDAASEISFRFADTAKMTILQNGNVGIRTASPSASLDIVNTATTGGLATLELNPGEHTAMTAEKSDFSIAAHTDTITGGYAAQRFSVFATPTISAASALTVTNADTVNIAGIPTTAGSAIISGASALRIPVAPQASANVGLVSLGSGAWDGSTAGYFTGDSSGTILAANSATGYTGNLMDLQVAGASKFKVDESGNVTAAGTITGSGLGDITSVGNVSSGAAFDGTQGTTLTFYNAGGNGILSYDGTSFNSDKPAVIATSLTSPTIIGGTTTTSDLNLQTTLGVGAAGADMHFLVGNNGATEAMTVLNSGYVGIGTTNPQVLLHLAQQADSADDILKIVSVQSGVTREFGLNNAAQVLVNTGTTSESAVRIRLFSDAAGGDRMGLKALPEIAFGPGSVAFDTRLRRGTNGGFVITGGTVNKLGINYADPGTATLAVSGNVGIGTTSPASPLHVDPAAQVTTTATFARTFIDNTNAITTNTGNTAVHGLMIDEPNITVGTATPTNAASLYISGAPTEATNNYALWVDDGNVQLDGNLTVGGTITGTVANAAPKDATYITQTANATLTAEQALSTLDTGLMKVTTATGVISSVTDSAGIAGVISDETGSGSLVLGTTPTFTTSLTSPLVIGGTTTTSALNLKTTTAAGTTGADMHFLVGNNGATEAVTILNSGNVGIGTTAPAQKLHVEGQCVTGDTLVPVIRLGAGSWEIGAGSKNKGVNDGVSVRKAEGVANGNGIGRGSLQNNREISEGRTIWHCKSDAQSGSISAPEYSGGQGQVSYESICPVSVSGERVDIRGNDCDENKFETKISERSRSGEDTESMLGYIRGDQRTNQFAKITSSSQPSAQEELGDKSLEQNLQTPNSQLLTPNSIECIPIKDIKPGDYVLSLNEQTGKIEPHRIKGLLDMGIKPVFKLTTENGRTIRTTGNHPYLVKEELGTGNLELRRGNGNQAGILKLKGREKPAVEKLGFEIEDEVVFGKSEIPDAQWIKVAGLKIGEKIAISNEHAFASLFDDDPNKALQAQKQQLHQHQLRILSCFLSTFVSWMDKICQDEICGTNGSGAVYDEADSGQCTKLSPKKPRMLIEQEVLLKPCNQSSSLLDNGQLKNPITNANAIIQNIQTLVSILNVWKNPLTQPATIVSLNTSNNAFDIKSLRLLLNIAINFPVIQLDETYHMISRLSSFFQKCAYADMNFSDFSWDAIVSIEYVGEEQVYDIEVEGTHNFVANGIIAHNTYISSNLGIGTTSPEFKLTLDKGATTPDGGILSIGTYGSGTALTTAGAGTRLIWYPKKAAFRAGWVDGTQWDDANVGAYSTAMGYKTRASGYGSTAMGYITTTSGDYSTAVGFDTTASGLTSTATGYSTIASGGISTAMGERTTASGEYSTAIGRYLTAGSAENTIVFGQGVSNANRLVNNTASSLMVGFSSTIPTLFVGPSSGAGTTGNVGIGTTAPTARLDVDGAVQTVTAPTQRAIINNTSAITTNTGATAVYGLTVDEPNITIGTATPTNAASLYISGAPTEATNNYALWVDDGNVQLDGNLTVGGTLTATGIGDITSIGNVTTGAAFDGTQGTTLTFYNAGGNGILSYDGTNFNLDKPAVIATSLTSPTLIGGTATTSDLNLKTTSAVGAAGADMHFLVGNNGATEAMTVLNNGYVGIGTTNPQVLLHLAQQADSADDILKIVSVQSGVTREFGLNNAAQVLVNTGTTSESAVRIRLFTDAAGGDRMGLKALPEIAFGPGSVAFDTRLRRGTNGGFVISGGTVNKLGINYTDPGTATLAVSGNVGIGTTSPTSPLQVDPAAQATTTATFARTFIDNTNAITTNTGNTALYGLMIDEPNITVGTATPTNAASLYISGAPTEATNNYALWVDDGNVQMDGNLTVSGTITASGIGDITSVGNVSSGAAFDGTQGTTLTFYNAGGNGILSYDGTNFNLDKPAVIATSLTSPTIIGGTTTTSDLNLQTTLGVGATGADMHFLVGNNGTTEAMTVLNSGNVGIGTATPGSKLQVNGNAVIGYSASTAGPSNGLAISGNVGIGTTNPGGPLDVNGRAGATSLKVASTFDDLYDGSPQYGLGWTTGTSHVQLAGWSGLEFSVNSGKSMVITYPNGNVGIGTTGPVSKLEVYQVDSNTNPITVTSKASSAGTAYEAGILFKGSTPSDANPYPTGRIYGKWDGTSNGTERLTLQSMVAGVLTDTVNLKNGNVGIGTTGPGAKLDVTTNSTGSYPILVRGDIDNIGGYSGISFGYNGGINYEKARIMVRGTSGYIQPEMHFLLDNVAGSDNADINDAKLSILPTGNVGIGTTVPTSILHTVASGAKTNPYSGNLLTNTATSSTDFINKYGLEIKSTGTWSGTDAKNVGLYVSSVTGGTNNYDAIFNGGGKVGIGTLSPNYTLDVAGTGIHSSSSTAGYGIYGEVTADGGYKYGVMGASSGTGDANYGVEGGAAGAATSNYGVYGWANSGTNNYGTYGIANSGIATNNYGGYFQASGGSTINYGIYAAGSGGADNLAGYFSGGVYISGNVGIGTTSPTSPLQVDPAAQATTTATFARTFIDNTNAITTNTGNTALYGLMIDEPNITVGTATPTNAASLYISGAPTEATNNYALWVDDGNVQLDGNLTVGGTITGTIANVAPKDATYITQTANATLTAEQALSTLDTGLMKVTTTTGVISSITDSAGIAGVISDETGTGSLVLGTAPTFTTSLTSPLIIGGTTTTSDLNLKTTSAAGTTGADMHFLVGNNGATEAMTILNSGYVGIGTTGPQTNLDIYGTDTGPGVNINISSGNGYYGGIGSELHDFYMYGERNIGIYPNWGNYTDGMVSVYGNLYTSGNIGIGTTSPTSPLQVDPEAQATTTATFARTFIDNTNAITTNTGNTALYGLMIDEPNITVGTATPTNAASLYISGAPTEATNNYALWVDDGNVQLDGNLTVGGTFTAPGIGDITSIGNVPSGAAFDGTQGTALTFYNVGGNGILSYDGTSFNSDKPAVITTSLTSPTVIGGTATTSDLNLKTTSAVGATGADMHFLVGNNGATEAMTILNSGYVGIGTTSPSQKLEVSNLNPGTSAIVQATSWTTNYYVQLGEDSGGSGEGYVNSYQANGVSALLGLRVNGSEKVTINNSGYVGIGTTAPAYNLHVIGSSTFDASGLTGSYPMYIYPNTNGNAIQIQGDASVAGTGLLRIRAGTYMRFDTLSSTERMRILSTGEVGIGTTAPAGPLEIDTDTASGVAVTIDQDDVDQTALDFDINNTAGDILNIDWGGATTQTGAINGIDVDLTNLTTLAASSVYGIHVNDAVANTTATEYGIYVEGTNWDYGLYVSGSSFLNSLTINGVPTITGNAASGLSSQLGGANTALKFITQSGDISISDNYSAAISYLGGRWSEAASGNHPIIANVAVMIPTIDAGAATVGNTATLYVEGAPSATVTGGNYALWVDNGVSIFDGSVGIGTTNPGTALQVAGSTGVSIGEDKAGGTPNTAGALMLFSAGDNAFYTTFTAGTQTANAAYTLPVADGTTGQVLSTNGSGVLSWAAAGSGDITSVGNVSSGAAFDGTQGTTLTFYNAGGNGILSYDGTSFNSDKPAVITTSLTSPTVIGGTATTSALNLKTTTAAGTTGADMHFLVGNNGATEAMTILNSGYVGIGTTNPTKLLYLSKGSDTDVGIFIHNTNNTNGEKALIDFGTSAAADSRGRVEAERVDSSNSKMNFYTYRTGVLTNAMAILNTGNVGIGTTAPGSKLSVSGGGSFGSTYAASAMADGNVAISGNLGIGTTDPGSYKLMVEGDARVTGYLFSNGRIAMYGGLHVGDVSDPGTDNLTVDGNAIIVGNVGIGTTSLAALLNCNVTADGTIVNFSHAGTVEGTISVSGATVTYGGFTGSHFGWSKGNTTFRAGELLIATGENKTSYNREFGKGQTIYGIAKTNITNDKRVFGVYGGEGELGPEKWHMINAVGDGFILVTDTNGDIEVGDYLTSSLHPGYAQKQNEDTLKNYTVGKAVQSVRWADEKADHELGFKWKLIACTF